MNRIGGGKARGNVSILGGEASDRARPKSAILRTPEFVMRRLAPLMSRWLSRAAGYLQGMMAWVAGAAGLQDLLGVQVVKALEKLLQVGLDVGFLEPNLR
jgi:hypothetical protein